MATIMSKFLPNVHGFHFPNKFDNVVFREWWGSWTTHGLCGGMAFAALDYFYSDIPVPNHTGGDFPDGKVPEANSILRGYIYNRLMDSFFCNGLSNALRFADWSEKPDHYTWLRGEGVPQLTKNGEFPKLCECLKNGPVALGLITTHSSLFSLGANHQVVAYGAEQDTATGVMKVYIYDNNHPDREIVLTSGPSDLHFFGSLIYVDGSRDEYRGFFVEDYSPCTPSYIDIAVSKPISNGILYASLGNPLEIGYTLKNVGQYPSSLLSYSLLVKDPAGAEQRYLFGNVNNSTTLQPGETRVCINHWDNFGTTIGEYSLKPSYESTQHMFIDNVPGATVVPCKIQYFSNQVLAEPPYAERVSIVKAQPGLQPTGFAKLDKGAVKYEAWWGYNPAGGRILTYDVRDLPITANRQLYLFVRFNTSNLTGTTVVSGTMKAVAVNLTVTKPDNSKYRFRIVMSQSTDALGVYYWGVHKPENLVSTYKLSLEISGIDAVQHYPLRNPIGDTLDSNPATIASVDKSKPPAYPFLQYEPGIDQNHTIDISSIPQTLPADVLEVNNDFTTATKGSLGVPGIPTGASLDFSNLTLHNVADVDYFTIDFQSLSGDDACTLEKGVSESVSTQLGLTITHYPPRLIIFIDNPDDNDATVEIYKPDSGNRTLCATITGRSSLVIDNPFRLLGEKKFYIAVKNPDFRTQGALIYNLHIRYLPRQDVFTASGGSFSKDSYDRRNVFLDGLFDALNLPRPGDDLINQSKNSNQIFESAQKIGVISDTKTFTSELNKYLGSAQAGKDLKAVAKSEYKELLKQGKQNLTVIAKKIVLKQIVITR